MTEALFGLLGAIIGGCFTFCIAAAIIGSGRDPEEEDRSGAPEGRWSSVRLHVEKNR